MINHLRAWRLHRQHQRQALTDGQALQLLRARANQHNTALTITYSEEVGWEVRLTNVAYTFDDTFSGAAIDAYELTTDPPPPSVTLTNDGRLDADAPHTIAAELTEGDLFRWGQGDTLTRRVLATAHISTRPDHTFVAHHPARGGLDITVSAIRTDPAVRVELIDRAQTFDPEAARPRRARALIAHVASTAEELHPLALVNHWPNVALPDAPHPEADRLRQIGPEDMHTDTTWPDGWREL